MTNTPVPRLLVSVRDEQEAMAALRGGADIIDVKDPDRGSLGRPDRDSLQAIYRTLVDVGYESLPLSVALGELRDTAGEVCDGVPSGVTFAKIGLSGMAKVDDWRDLWVNTRRRYEGQHDGRLGWVAVAYADQDLAQSPPLEEVIDVAIATGSSGLLIDTYDKSHGGLLEYIDCSRLVRAAEAVRRHGLFIAVAGRLSIDDLTTVAGVRPDIVAVRSAVCENGDRRGRISESDVRRIRHEIAEVFSRTAIVCAANDAQHDERVPAGVASDSAGRLGTS